MCTCNLGEQTSDHLIYECRILQDQRRIMKQQIAASGGTWPTTNSDLIAKYSKAFCTFVNSIDFNKIQ